LTVEHLDASGGIDRTVSAMRDGLQFGARTVAPETDPFPAVVDRPETFSILIPRSRAFRWERGIGASV